MCLYTNEITSFYVLSNSWKNNKVLCSLLSLSFIENSFLHNIWGMRNNSHFANTFNIRYQLFLCLDTLFWNHPYLTVGVVKLSLFLLTVNGWENSDHLNQKRSLALWEIAYWLLLYLWFPKNVFLFGFPGLALIVNTSFH